mmetsp:Transcript_30583/g.56635  ORF Transcript_30583/g.56635 Transcript_30583/m.56635 type:complete len:221 (-) Transcript_30583:42-704(-)
MAPKASLVSVSRIALEDALHLPDDPCPFTYLLVDGAEFCLEDVNEFRQQILLRERDSLLVWIEGEVRVLADPSSDEDVAPGNGLLLSRLRVFLARRCSHDANVGHLDLSTAIRASSPVDSDGPVDRHLLFKLLHNTFGVRLRLDKSQTTELCTCAAHEVSLDEARIHLEPRAGAKDRFREQVVHLSLVDVGKDEVLLHGETDLAVRVLLREVGHFAALAR